MSAERPGEPVFCVAAEFLGSFDAVVTMLDGNPADILRDAGLDTHLLSGLRVRAPFSRFAQMLESTASALDCPNFGLTLAHWLRDMNAMMWPLDLLLHNAPTLGEAFRCGSAHMNAYTSGVRMIIDPRCRDGFVAQRFDILPDDLPLTPQFSEYLLLLSHNAALHLTGGAIRAHEVWFSHERGSPSDGYRARFGATVKFGQQFDALFFKADDLARPILGSNRAVFRNEETVIAGLYPSPAESADHYVRNALRTYMPLGIHRREDIATVLEISVRTLHRRLARCGTSFERVRDDVRRSLAIKYLARRDLPLTDVAAWLGYSELAVLSRSCRRWFSESPSQLRRSLAREPMPGPVAKHRQQATSTGRKPGVEPLHAIS